MDTDKNSPTDVLHSENHSKLSAEEIAKAVARHNREHSGKSATDPKSASSKPKKGGQI
jgi:hypothetical protein